MSRVLAARAEPPPRAMLRPGCAGTLRRSLAPVPGSVPLARWLTVRACERWDLTRLSGPAAQVVTELVANAVRHGAAPLALGLARVQAAFLLVAVYDAEPRLPRRRVPGPDGHGHGLLLVDEFAHRWGAVALRDWTPVGALRPRGGGAVMTGKVVWALVAPQ